MSVLLCVFFLFFSSPPAAWKAVHTSGIAKGGPGRARARPKHFVRPVIVTQSHAKRRANGLVYSGCPANTNDLAKPLVHTVTFGHGGTHLIPRLHGLGMRIGGTTQLVFVVG